MPPKEKGRLVASQLTPSFGSRGNLGKDGHIRDFNVRDFKEYQGRHEVLQRAQCPPSENADAIEC